MRPNCEIRIESTPPTIHVPICTLENEVYTPPLSVYRYESYLMKSCL